MATGSVSPKAGKVLDIPDQTVTIGTATDGGDGQSVSVAFTAGSITTGGPVFKYTALSNPGSFTTSGSTSPLVVNGLTAGTAYTFQVVAQNPSGNSSAGYSTASNSVTPVVPGNFESIATVVGNDVATTITFSSIPSTYKQLQLRMFARYSGGSGATTLVMRLNGDTASNYSNHRLLGNGTSVSAAGSTTDSAINLNGAGWIPDTTYSYNGVAIFDIIDYESTTKTKTIRIHAGKEANRSETGLSIMASALWNSTSAVTSISLTNAMGVAWAAGSTFALYGIKGN